MTIIPQIVKSTESDEICSWLQGHRRYIDEVLADTGALLLRGFGVYEQDQFREAADFICGSALEYRYRSTPRTDLGQGIYTATEYPSGLSIPQHNENAYQRDWPTVIMFGCLRPADDGAGQTPISDVFEVTKQIDQSIQQEFHKKQVAYIRNYYQDIDIPWQVVFQTQSREEVNQYCRDHDIEANWLPDGTLRTRQTCHSFATHPASGRSIWFNQAHLFHPSSLDEGTRSFLSELFQEDEFPRNVTFADGSPIDLGMLQEIRAAFEAQKVVFSWKKGDVLILDNMRVAHGRTPYKGPRRILTAMGHPYSTVAAR